MLEGGRNWRTGIVAVAAMRVKRFFEKVEFLFHLSQIAPVRASFASISSESAHFCYLLLHFR